ncbi:DotG/IcmE/VirB10 family protein [Fangia hongkongensis]|uniref:DotG/IcmE/VirB10 family protein n=1 Tax=Fangia hongkongensis TaxID=270495 RepID=UPI00037B042A|nr:DotG/IcmE/VirB10 family protein [Fangia hongkongensis]MBK2124442.1 DotG/IcmE/VirB10 family protein [Fangia hongkongensis]
MKSKHNQRVKARNWQFTLSFILAVLMIILAVFAYMYFSSDKNIGDFTTINSRAQQSQSDYVNSAYVKNNREEFEQKQAAMAAKEGRSHIVIGSINAIEPTKKQPPRVMDAYKKPESFSERLKQRNQQQKQHNHMSNDVQKKEDGDGTVELSKAFKDALKNISSEDKQTLDQQKTQPITVTTADYYSTSMKAIIKPPVENTPIQKILAGTTLYALIVNTVNSDFKNTPVVAKIEIGMYRGAYLLGQFATDNEWAKGISITFNKMIYKSQEYAISAIATNADYQPNLYDDIDNHWFQRIGGSIVGSFLGGVKGLAKQYEGTNQNVILTEGGGSTQYGSKPDSKQLAIGFAGGAAGDLSSQLEPTFKAMWNRPSTVTVNAGHAIGVLFTNTVEFTHSSNRQTHSN